MKKCTLALSAILSLSMAVPAFAGIGVSIDGVSVPFTTSSGSPVIDENGRTLVPLRASMEAFGCNVKWDESSKTATVTKDNTIVEVTVGKTDFRRNGIRVKNDTYARIIDGRVYLPIRAVLESFGASVGWDQSSQSVVVSTSALNHNSPNHNELRKAKKTAHNYIIDGISYHSSGSLSASFVVHPSTQNDVWVDLYTPDGSDTSMNRFFAISTGDYEINEKNEIRFGKNKDDFYASISGTDWLFSYKGKTLIFSSVTKDGIYTENGVTMVVYRLDDGLGAFINASELAKYFGIDSPATFVYSGSEWNLVK